METLLDAENPGRNPKAIWRAEGYKKYFRELRQFLPQGPVRVFRETPLLHPPDLRERARR